MSGAVLTSHHRGNAPRRRRRSTASATRSSRSRSSAQGESAPCTKDDVLSLGWDAAAPPRRGTFKEMITIASSRPQSRFHRHSDKYAVRDYVDDARRQVLIPLSAHETNPREIDYEALPTRLRGEAQPRLEPQRLVTDKEEVNWEAILLKLQRWDPLPYHKAHRRRPMSGCAAGADRDASAA